MFVKSVDEIFLPYVLQEYYLSRSSDKFQSNSELLIFFGEHRTRKTYYWTDLAVHCLESLFKNSNKEVEPIFYTVFLMKEKFFKNLNEGGFFKYFILRLVSLQFIGNAQFRYYTIKSLFIDCFMS